MKGLALLGFPPRGPGLIKEKKGKATMRRMHTDQEITKLVEENPSVKTALALATETAKTYKKADFLLTTSDFEGVFVDRDTPFIGSDPEEPDIIEKLQAADIIIVYDGGADGNSRNDPHFFRKMRYSEEEETAYFECFEMDTGKLYHYEMSVSSVDEGGGYTITPLKTFEPLMSDIVDGDGHKRFISIPVSTASNLLSASYAGAVLSGKVLKIVVRGTIPATVAIPATTKLAYIAKEDLGWIYDEIVHDPNVSTTYVTSTTLSIYKGNAVSVNTITFSKTVVDVNFSNYGQIDADAGLRSFTIELTLDID